MARLYDGREVGHSVIIAAVVGTILVTINQGPGAFVSPPSDAVTWGRMALNYAVPFTVASVSAILANRARG